ncbi:unnamed protein product [Protopolystoma xenopodis]|uniref:N(6)-adenosine-methyltransferase non-catalytic subunit METTL14 n=1 Tax=Protopolystoma xenopodis TaxID=117903 RepID=A0A3S5BFL5_9PLAT|nr:unnamed protein product [Protopolystoma xenopodis]
MLSSPSLSPSLCLALNYPSKISQAPFGGPQSSLSSFRLNTESDVDIKKSCRDGCPNENDDELAEKQFTGSSTFLKGTQSANPHNDYSQHFVDTGERPQNFIRDTGLKNRFEEYPKLRELIRLKDALIVERATPPMYLRADLSTFDLCQLGSQFDTILIDPPLEEYTRKGISQEKSWSWEEARYK